MRKFTSLIGLSACLFALLCLSSVGYASPPSVENDVHFCLPLDLEDLRERDSLYAATKQALNLNVGEPRTVRMIYFLPNDRPFRQEVVDSMKVTIRQVQTFYADQMEAHGYGRKTFRFETDAQGDPVVHRVDGGHPNSYYRDNTVHTVSDEIEQAFDVRKNIYFIVIDNSIGAIVYDYQSVGGVGRRRGKNGGSVLVPDGFSFHTAAHELGHAFGLWHDFRDDAYIMSYGSGSRRSLSACAAGFLVVHPYFNSNTSIGAAVSSGIALISPREYSPGSKSISVQLSVIDSDGLHQVLLFVTTRSPHVAAGSFEVKACRGLNGEREAIVEFEYDGVIPSDGGTRLSNPSLHEITFSVVDIYGNETRKSFGIVELSTHHIATLAGHTGRVLSVSFSPDGSILASGSGDRTVRLWDVATGQVLTRLWHIGWVLSVSFSPDGSILASGSGIEQPFAFISNRVRLWDVETGRELTTLKGHTGEVTSVSFSPDGSTLASGSYDRTVVLWDIATGRELTTLEGHTGRVLSVSFSPDGSILASGSGDRTVRLWDIETGRELTTLEHRYAVSSVLFSPDGQTLATDTMLWDIATGRELTTLEHRYAVSSVSFSPDGQTLAANSGSKVLLLDVATGRVLTTFEHTDRVSSVSFSPDGQTLAASAYDGTIRLWDASESTQPRPRTLVKISGDNQQGTPGAALANAYVVEVRDQYGNPLQGAQVTFAITFGQGRLSGRFTDENAITDANGRAQSTLTLGPNTGKNTVEVYIIDTDLDPVTFNAMGVGTPTIPILRSDYQTWHLPDGAIVRLGKGYPEAVAFSPDGQRLAVPGSIGIWIYDTATALELALLTGHTDRVLSVSFSPDGSILASGSDDGMVELWDVATGRMLTTLEGHTGEVTSVSFSPDGSTLASVSSVSGDYTVVLWDVATGRARTTLEGHTGEVTSVSFSSDGSTLASGSDDGMVELWDVATGRMLTTLEGHTGEVTSVSFSSDGSILASGSDDGMVELWDVATGRMLTTLALIRNFFPGKIFISSPSVTSVSFSSDGSILASGSDDGMVELWDVATGRELTTLEGHTGEVTSVSFSPDGSILASGSDDGPVVLWDVATTNSMALEGHRGSVRSVSFSPDGQTLAATSDRTVVLWDVATGRVLTTLEGHIGAVRSVSFSPDGQTLAATSDRTVVLWDVETGRVLTTLALIRNFSSGKIFIPSVTFVSFSPDGQTLASGSDDGMVELWDVATGRMLTTLEGHTGEVTSVLFSPDGSILASGSSDRTIVLWDVATGRARITLTGHRSAVYSVSFSPDGTMLASGSWDRTVVLWDVETGRARTTLTGHRDWVSSLSFSPDGSTLASGSYDRTVVLWDVETGRARTTLTGHRDWVSSLSFSPDGSTLASGSGDGTALLWDVSEYVTPVVSIPDTNLREVVRNALGKSPSAPITMTDMTSLTALDASNRNIRELVGLEAATNLTELNLTGNPLSSHSINTHIPTLQARGVEVLFDKPTTTATPDFDGDGTVGVGDFLLFVEQFGLSQGDAGYDAQFDLDGDGIIGLGDFMIFANSFGKAASALEGSGG